VYFPSFGYIYCVKKNLATLLLPPQATFVLVQINAAAAAGQINSFSTLERHYDFLSKPNMPNDKMSKVQNVKSAQCRTTKCPTTKCPMTNVLLQNVQRLNFEIQILKFSKYKHH
jgi:hypothetical protein